MTTMKITLAIFSGIGGVASLTTSSIVANLPALTPPSAISNETTVSLTLGLVFIGISGTATAAWKLSRAWSALENKATLLERELGDIKARLNIPDRRSGGHDS